MLHRRKNAITVLLVIAAACIGGLGVSVAAFGQSTDATSDYTVPLGDYTTTTPGSVPATPTIPAVTAGGKPTTQDEVSPTTTSGQTPSAPTPSTATRRGPSHLAFTGAEPLVIGGLGVTLMLAGFALHRRRRPGGSAL